MADFTIEKQYPNQIVTGVDEAGRGPLAGSVVAAAVIVNPEYYIESINDSKKLSPTKREKLYQLIIKYYNYAVGIVCSEEIDKINILEATKKACKIAVQKLEIMPNVVIVDGNMKFSDQKFRSIVKGDTKSYSIAAASIVAKVTRDQIMADLAVQYPMYYWHKNFGYGTKQHISMIEKYGITKYHRKSFAPINSIIKAGQ